jgi:transcriptional regulator with XRE-family HTH domain
VDSLSSNQDAQGVAEELLKFGNRVRALRRKLKLSQEQLAHDCKLDRSYIGGVERGQRNVSLVNIHKIAAALRVDASNLFDRSEEIKSDER